MKIKGLRSLDVYEHDLPDKIISKLTQENYLAIDTETGGLDYRKTSLFLIQIATPSGSVFIIKKPDKNSKNLIKIIQNPSISLIFHNAAFDIAFLKVGLMAEPGANTHCTKTLMKIIFPQYSSGLKTSLKYILNINMNKNIDHTKWDQKNLTKRQIEYAATDVLYLYRLLKVLKAGCSPRQYNIYCRAMQAIRFKTLIEVEGYTDLFRWEKEHQKVNQENRLWWNRLLSSKFEEEKNVTM